MTLVVNAMRYSRNAAILAAFFVLVVLVGCSSELEIKKLSGRTMGTSWSVVIANPIASHDQDSLQTEIEAVLLEVNRQMSTYDPGSEISQFNQSNESSNLKPPSSTNHFLR
mgnify:CR=1 FL=1